MMGAPQIEAPKMRLTAEALQEAATKQDNGSDKVEAKQKAEGGGLCSPRNLRGAEPF